MQHEKVIVSILQNAIEHSITEVGLFLTAETGGVLLGRMTGSEILVEQVTGPGPRAVHLPDYFEADHDYQQQQIELAYADSNGELQYIGEWHSHLQVIPEPSEQDHFAANPVRAGGPAPPIVMIIGAVGLLAFGWYHFRVFTWDGVADRLSPLSLRIIDPNKL